MPSVAGRAGDVEGGGRYACAMGDEHVRIPGESEGSFADRPGGDPEAVRALAVEAARTLADERCEEVAVLDVRELSQVSDYLVVASGTSQRQMRSAIEHVRERAGGFGARVFRQSADDDSLWVLCDFVDVVVHVFEPNTRAHYDLEMMWGDAPRVDWRRPQDHGTPADYARDDEGENGRA